MADQEVIKHTKKIYSIWGAKAPIWHKLKEFAIEIIIIVFAVSLSIWLHDRSEHKHLQTEVKEFMLGLKSDLARDTVEMKADLKTFDSARMAFHFISTVKRGQDGDMDSLRRYQKFFLNTTGFLANNGRFEGFKSSGKIGAIENIELQNDVMDLYQENIPNLLTSTAYYTNTKIKWIDFFMANLKRLNDSTYNTAEILAMDQTQNFARILIGINEIELRYYSCIELIRRIIKEIEEEYVK